MAKYTAQTAFDEACANYERAKEVIRELTRKVQVVAKGYSFEIAMREYDELLQAILLKEAFVDGYFLEVEKQFINNITDYGDVLQMINRTLRESSDSTMELSWDMMSVTNNSELVDGIINLSIERNVEDFVDVFAVVDAVTSTNYIECLKEATFNIIASFAFVDGDDSESDIAEKEAFAGFKLFELMIEERWLRVKSENNG